MIYRKPTVISIKAEEDMQDIQQTQNTYLEMTPNNQFKNRLEDRRNQMDIERSSNSQSPYSVELFNQILSNIREDHVHMS